MVHSLPAFSDIQDLLGFVIICMARSAIGDGVYILDDLVLNFHVALIAFDFILINMLRMHEICILIFIQSLLFSVTFVTVLPWDFPVPENGVAVTFVTRKSVIEDQSVVITRRLGANKGFLRMAVVTVIDLGIMLAFFKMTNKTRTLRDCDMFSLHDLRMTARALELFSSFEILKMDLVVERDLVELHFSFQEPFFMTPFPQATVVPDFCPGFGFDIEFRPVAADHNQSFDLFSQLGLDSASRGIMTNAALEIFMR
jgi:hypothetical protein